MVRVKICGITNVEDALLACDLGADAIGLNFYDKSPRCISPFAASKIISKLPPFVAPVGVFVNWQAPPVTTLVKALGLSAAQLHGDEPPKLVSEIAKKVSVIKALHAGRGSAQRFCSTRRTPANMAAPATLPTGAWRARPRNLTTSCSREASHPKMWPRRFLPCVLTPWM
jgi:phosphoribosylanthranilate isomerase